MVSVGTPNGTVPGAPAIDLSFRLSTWPQPFGALHYFQASTGTSSEYALYVTDGTAPGTRRVSEPGSLDSFAATASRVFFFKSFSPTAPSQNPPVLSLYDPRAGGIAGTVFDDRDADGT